MKTMSPEEMIDLLPEEKLTGATGEAVLLAPELPPGYFEKLVEEKQAFSVLIGKDGVSHYRVIWQKIFGGQQIYILFAQQMKPDADKTVLFAGMDRLAKLQKVSAVVFQTARRGLVELANEWGAAVFAVRCKKSYAV